jgi:hypothetical protein
MNKPSITPTNVVGGAIAIYEDVWPDFLETISNCTNRKGIEFVSATVLDPKTGKTYANIVRNTDAVGITTNAESDIYFKELDIRCKKLIKSVVDSYKTLFNISENILDEERYSLLRYSPGQYYHEHYDGGTESARAISVLIYLNDDYEGGEIEFINFNHKIKPKAGTVMLFPSGYAYRHIAHSVVSGTKYVIVTWLHDRAKEA